MLNTDRICIFPPPPFSVAAPRRPSLSGDGKADLSAFKTVFYYRVLSDDVFLKKTVAPGRGCAEERGRKTADRKAAIQKKTTFKPIISKLHKIVISRIF